MMTALKLPTLAERRTERRTSTLMKWLTGDISIQNLPRLCGHSFYLDSKDCLRIPSNPGVALSNSFFFRTVSQINRSHELRCDFLRAIETSEASEDTVRIRIGGLANPSQVEMTHIYQFSLP